MESRFHTDIVGSFLRPDVLLRARERGVTGTQLRAIEDEAIREVVQLQEEVGLPIVTDGEFRRGHWTHLVMEIADGFALIDGFPVPVAPLRQTASVVDTELAFLQTLTDKPIKITLPQPTALGLLWREDLSGRSYPTRDEFVDEVCDLLNHEAKALVTAGAAYVQIDAPQYTVAPPGTTRQDYRDMVAVDQRVFEGVTGCITGVHLCRGNYRRPTDAPAAPYEPYAAEVFNGFSIDRLLLEYDDYQAGDFTPLRHVPDEVTVVLGLVTTKWPIIEQETDLIHRIEEAASVVPLERLALSPQCGFSSLATLQNVTPEVQRAKLELIKRVAEDVWGTIEDADRD